MSWNLVLHYAFLACCVTGVVFSTAAHRNLAPKGKDTFGVLFWRQQDEFTPRGWRFRQIALVFCYLACAIALGQQFT